MIKRFLELEKRIVKPYGLKRFIWRLFGRIGHAFFRFYPPEVISSSGKKLLNLGAGPSLQNEFVNADFYRLHHLLKRNSANWMLDITRPLKCKDNYWDGVYLSHVNEHITFSDNYKLLMEIFRVMKAKATLRLVIPDLDTYLNWNEIRKLEPKMNRYKSLPEAISNLAQNHDHISIWNFDLMEEVLVNVGFINIRKAAFADSEIVEFKDLPNHKWQSFYLEANKPG